VHDLDICSLDRVVRVEGFMDPMLAVVVCTSSYLDFISYAVTLTTLRTIGLDRRRLSSCIASWICGGVPLDVGSVGCVVGGIASSIVGGVCWSISRWVGWSIGCSVGSGIGGLHYSFSPRPSSATRSRAPWLQRRWRGHSNLLLE
jgi:hypothetical protein